MGLILYLFSTILQYESGALVPRAFPSKRQFVTERHNAFKLSSDRHVTLSPLYNRYKPLTKVTKPLLMILVISQSNTKHQNITGKGEKKIQYIIEKLFLIFSY